LWFQALIIIMMVLSGMNSSALGSLYFFHTFLVFIAGKGTYDWLIDRRNMYGTHAFPCNCWQPVCCSP
jgi:hypothetical protein